MIVKLMKKQQFSKITFKLASISQRIKNKQWGRKTHTPEVKKKEKKRKKKKLSFCAFFSTSILSMSYSSTAELGNTLNFKHSVVRRVLQFSTLAPRQRQTV